METKLYQDRFGVMLYDDARNILELRWFAETEQDEQFLLKGAREVFDHPSPPETHATRFIPNRRACATPHVIPLSLNDPVGLKP